MKFLRFVVWAFAWLAALVWATWAARALYLDFPTASDRCESADLNLEILFAARHSLEHLRCFPNYLVLNSG